MYDMHETQLGLLETFARNYRHPNSFQILCILQIIYSMYPPFLRNWLPPKKVFFYGIQIFISVSARIDFWVLSWAR